MPELPEVENIVRDLRRKILTKKILKVLILSDKAVKNNKKFFTKKVKGCEIEDIRRRGKFIIIDLSNDYCLMIHLKMTGQLLYQDLNQAVNQTIDKHTHAIFEFKNKGRLVFRDIRRFGYLKIEKKDKLEGFLSPRVGPDYLDISCREFSDVLISRRRMIKGLLLDQKIFSGLGNIYACESLYRAGIHPQTTSSDIKKKKVRKLYYSIQDILQEAINKGGSSVGDYLRPDSSKGRHQQYHLVYRKEGKVCPKCKRRIERVKINNRGTFFCPGCQKLAP
jgi:formamidopyrimidine-DNA glycosylase